MTRIISLVIAMAAAGLSYERQNPEQMLAIVLLSLVPLSMIWFSDFWANYILPFGFWERFASDFKQASHQGPILAFLGWIVLILVFVLSLVV